MMDVIRCKDFEAKNTGHNIKAGRFENCRLPTESEIKEHYKSLKNGNIMTLFRDSTV